MNVTTTSEQLYPEPLIFDPDRYGGGKPDFASWLPCGGGIGCRR
ncbi:hypothetical protein [Nocardia sp. NPDC004123]